MGDPKQSVEAEGEYESVQVSASLLDKFAKYPKALREALEEAYTEDIYKILDCVKSGLLISQQYTYQIVRSSRTDGCSATDYKNVQLERFPNASMANVAVLEQFLKLTPSKKAEFVKAQDIDTPNPEFAAINSVSPGQMGWGFDSFGCLSLHKTIIDNKKLKHTFIYVERKKTDVQTSD